MQDFFLEQKDGGWAMRDNANGLLDGLLSNGANNPAAERDGKLSDTLRNTLFGDFGEDLASRNIFRGRDMDIVDYKDLAKCYGATADAAVRLSASSPAASWNSLTCMPTHPP